MGWVIRGHQTHLFLGDSPVLKYIKAQVGMNGDTFSIKAPKECSKKFAAPFKGKVLTRGDVLRIFFFFLEDLGAPLYRLHA